MKVKHILLFVSVVLLDQLSKWLLDINMQIGDSITLIPGFFRITYLHNTGAAWSMFEGKMGFFMIVTVIALIVMGYFYYCVEKKDALTKYGLVLMMAGTLGNFIDRLCFQHVRDFLDFVILGYDFPVFNVADIALCVGVFLILVSVFLEERFGGVKKCEK